MKSLLPLLTLLLTACASATPLLPTDQAPLSPQRSGVGRTTPAPTVAPSPTTTPLPPPVHYRANPQRTGHFAGAAPRTLTGVKWQVTLDGLGVHGAPVAAEGLLFVPLQNGQLAALELETGAERWRHTATDGIITSPAVAAGRVYFGSEDGVFALEAASGAVAWRHATATRLYSAPLVVDGVLYSAREDGVLLAVDAATGAERWQTPTGERALWPPAYAAGALYLPSANSLFAVEAASGAVVWEKSFGLEWTPLAVDEGRLYAGSGDGVFYALSLETGAEVWRHATGTGTWWSAPAVGQGLVFAGNQDQNIYAFDAATGEERWRFAAEDWAVSDPVLAGGVLFVGVGNHEGREGPRRLYALDAATGARLWDFRADSRLLSAPVIDNGVVYALTTSGVVYALH